MGFFKKTSDAPEKQDAVMTSSTVAPAAASPGDGELVAVISAAIAAFEGGAIADGLIVRRIRRIQDQMPVWKRAGLSDCIDSRKM